MARIVKASHDFSRTRVRWFLHGRNQPCHPSPSQLMLVLVAEGLERQLNQILRVGKISSLGNLMVGPILNCAPAKKNFKNQPAKLE